jgi:mannose-6-phosphate isomerase
MVGRLSRYEDRFPLLIKFLFPGDKLSVQVHPDDAGAQKYGQPCGKTECWYVLRAEPGAQVALGLKPGITLDEFRKSIEETRAEGLLNWVDVYAGDMIYVAAGTVHTIGGGMVLVETQQTSDITYRLYDYGRPRELHVDQGLEAIKLRTNAGKVVRPQDANSNVLITSPFFQVEKMRLRELLHTPLSPDSPHIVVAVNGSGVVESQGMEPVSFATGEAVVIPAGVKEYSLRPQWDIDIMRMSLPLGSVPEPQIQLPQSVSAP